MKEVPAQLRALFARRQSDAKFSLEPIRRLCAALGHPERRLRFIHIAGTNGKGSVAAMCAAVTQEAGLRAGLYTSPHLYRYHERFRLDGVEITDAELAVHLDRVLKIAGDATFFEISTALALSWFAAREVDLVAWETGIGGRLDATNVVTPRVSVIASIGLDHTQLLGDTRAEIAREKAGIFKSGVPAVTCEHPPEVAAAIEAAAAKRGTPLRVVGEKELGAFEPPLAGAHQRANAALAVAALRLAIPALGDDTIRAGLRNTRWPARCQLVERGGDRPPILVDGAHNPPGAEALAAEVRRRWPEQAVTLVFGALADKRIAEMGVRLRPVADEVLLVPTPSERAASPAALRAALPGGRTMPSLAAALDEADRLGRPVVVAGSLFLAGEALILLGGGRDAGHPNETFPNAR
ncbi:MAG: bifunctional folylpolyglutamate synthase/dihydrofolate synthase [Verrucomicrobiae bacterium]|nr:bifunctional folylpolyglutamate synthase/dihydrofolate synthase [Verrucomicrobiae bacterium]